MTSVTRFGEIPPIWQLSKNLWFIWFWGKFQNYFGTICVLLGKFSLLKMAKYCSSVHTAHLWSPPKSWVELIFQVPLSLSLEREKKSWKNPTERKTALRSQIFEISFQKLFFAFQKRFSFEEAVEWWWWWEGRDIPRNESAHAKNNKRR